MKTIKTLYFISWYYTFICMVIFDLQYCKHIYTTDFKIRETLRNLLKHDYLRQFSSSSNTCHALFNSILNCNKANFVVLFVCTLLVIDFCELNFRTAKEGASFHSLAYWDYFYLWTSTKPAPAFEPKSRKADSLIIPTWQQLECDVNLRGMRSTARRRAVCFQFVHSLDKWTITRARISD